MKRILSGTAMFMFFIVIFSFSGFAYDEILIDDSANLFDESQETEINSSLFEFFLETSYSAAVITTDYAEGKTSQSYADDYYDNLVVSEGWSQNGILFLIDMDNREVCISTMGECISVYSDSIDYIIDCGYDELVNGLYSDCIIHMIDATSECALNIGNDYYDDQYNGDYYCDYYIDDNYNSGIITDSKHSSGLDLGNISVCIIISLVIAAVSVLAVKSSYKNTGKGDEFDADDLILNLTASNDNVISRNVITTRVPKNNNHNRSGGKSGYSGGGVSHRSSGGFSHGGGSRKF